MIALKSVIKNLSFCSRVFSSGCALLLLFNPVRSLQLVAVCSGESLLIGPGTSGHLDRDWKVDGRA